MKSSLLLAGGGMKVAFQAGVLQVLLSEAGLEFDQYDACSGGAFNLAMLCDGRSGVEIADAWRDTRPRDGLSFRLQDLVRVPLRQRSLLTLDAYRTKIFKRWGLNFDRINASPVDATFTAYNCNRARRETFEAKEMDPDRLVACLSQAVWFPPITIDGQIYTDAVFDTDANFQPALERQAKDIWVIWTVSRRPEWMPGLMAQFFHALEVSANGTLAAEKKDAELAHGAKVTVLEFEVPVHYLILAGEDRLHRVVERGVQEARRWCDERKIPYVPIDRSDYYDTDVSLRFIDHLAGRVDGRKIEADLLLEVRDAGEFVSANRQCAGLGGSVTCSLVEGEATVIGGHARIFVDQGDPTRKRMEYVAHLETVSGGLMTLTGLKTVESTRLRDAVQETMTMRCWLYEGQADLGQPGSIADGVLWMEVSDVARQFVRAQSEGPNRLAKLKGLGQYGLFFAGNLWDVSMRRWLTYSPF